MLVQYQGKPAYYRECTEKDFMRKFQGFGMSRCVLVTLKDLPFLILYKGTKNHLYLSSIKQFKESDKNFLNDGRDAQVFVSVKDMTELELKENV